MKKTKSRILSLLLTAAMVFSLLPTAALAANYDTVPTVAVTGGQLKVGATLTATAVAGADTTTLAYEWQSSADGSTNWVATASTADSATYTVAAADVGKFLRVQVTASGTDSGTVQSAATAQVPYTINLALADNTGTDDAYFGTTGTLTTCAATSATINYVLDGSGNKSNSITYTGGTVTPVTTPATATSTYTVDSTDATDGVITLTATFAHENWTPTIIYVNGAATDDTGDGLTVANAVKTLATAYNKIKAEAPPMGEIRVLSDLTAAAVTNINAEKTVTIASYDAATGAVAQTGNARHKVTRGFGQVGTDASGAVDAIFHVTLGHLMLENIIIDGDKGTSSHVASATRHIYIEGGTTAAEAAKTTVHLKSGAVLQNGASSMAGTAALTGFSTGYGNLYIYDGARIINNDNSSAGNSRSNVIEAQYGGVYLLGGEISGNKLGTGAETGAVLMMTNGNLFIEGNPKVTNNKTADGAQANVYLNARTIKVNGALTEGANIGVALAVMPTSSAKTKDIAVKGTHAIQTSDAAYFHSDKGTSAGVRLDGATGTDAAKVVLDWDARVIVSTDVTFDNDGKANISINPTTVGTHYAILDSTGAVVAPNVTVTGGAANGNAGWYTADNSGEMTFGDLDPANDPYQVVTSNDSATPPAATSTKVGDLLSFTYVSANGVNGGTGTGTRTNPYLTIEYAINKVAAPAANRQDLVILMTNITRETGYQDGNSAAKRITITSEGAAKTIFRGGTDANSQWHLSTSGNDLTLKNIIVDGSTTLIQKWGDFFINTGTFLTLGDGAVLKNYTKNRPINIRDGGTVIMLPGSRIENCVAGTNPQYPVEGGSGAYTGTDGAGSAVYLCPGGVFDMRGGTITGNTGSVAKGAAVFGEKGSAFKMSGTPVVTGNTANSVAANVYLNDSDATLGGGQTITLIGDMKPGANVCVYVKNMPTTTGQKVDVATNAKSSDAAYFHSDKASEAGVVFENNKVILSYDARAQVDAKVDKAGHGQLTVITNPTTQYYINDEQGNVPEGVVAYDSTGATVTPVAGWYQTDNSPLVFKPLELAKEYQVCSKTSGQTGNTAWGDGSVIEIPVVGDNLYAKPDANDATKTTIVIDPADKDIKYAVLDESGAQVFPTTTDEWVSGTGDKIVIELPNLGSGEKYQVVGVPIGNETAKPADKDNSGETVVTPPSTMKEVGTTGNGDNITRVPDSGHAGKDKITVAPTTDTQDYGVYNPVTGKTEWKPGNANGDGLVFDDLDPNVDYQVVTRTHDTDGTPGDPLVPSIPTQGVTVPKNPSLDSVTGKVETNGTPETTDDATITINPTDPTLDYGIVDKDGNELLAPNNVWKPGTDGTISFPGLKPGDGYIIVTKPHGVAQPTTPADANGGLPVIAPVAPTGKPDKDGGNATDPTSAKREPNAGAATDKITIPAAEATSEYKYAVRDEDGNYYTITGTTPTAGNEFVTGNGTTDIVFNNLPMGKDYEIVKLPTAPAIPADAVKLPSITPVPKLPPVVGENDITTGIENDGDAFITVNPTDSDYNYILVGPDGTAVVVTPGNGGSITFPDLRPGEEYKIVTQKRTETPLIAAGDAMTGKVDRATDVQTPVLAPGAITGGKDTTTPGKTQIVIDPSSSEVKYVVTDNTGKVVGVQTGNGGKLVIGGLDANKEYTISTVPKDTTDPSGTITPTTPTETVKTPTTDISNIPGADGGATKPTLTPGSGSITINPTVAGKVYEVVDPATGAVVGTVTGPVGGGSVTINGLEANKEYVVQVKDPQGANPGDPTQIPVILDKVTTPGGGSTGSIGGGSSSNATVNKPNGGTVTVNPTNPKPGDKVTITVKPDEGFTTDKVVVKTTPGGKEVELTDNGDGTYTYTQPKEKVTIDATFKKVTGDPNSNGVSDLLSTVDHTAYLKGNAAGNFAPTADMTRGEVAQMFYNLLKNKDTNLGNKASFSDVSAAAWYATAVNTLANIGVLEGRGDGNYDPETPISRAEFVTIATRFAAKTTGSKTYTDVAADYWAAEAIAAASYYGWIDGYEGGTFKPTANIARSEAVKVVNAMLARSGDKAFIDKAEGLKTFPDVPKTDWAYYEIVEATQKHDYAKKDGVESWKK